MRRHIFMTLAGAALTLALVAAPQLALATHDSGRFERLLRMNADGSRLLIADCDIQEMEGRLAIVEPATGEVLETLELEDDESEPPPLMLCSAMEEAEVLDKALSSPSMRKSVRSFVKKHGMQTVPVIAARAPKGEAHVVLTIGLRAIEATLFEGAGATQSESWRGSGGATAAGSAEVAWHPEGTVAVVYGVYASSRDSVIVYNEPIRAIFRVTPRESPPLAGKAIAERWAEFAAGEFRRCRKDPRSIEEFCPRAHAAYGEAITFDPKSSAYLFTGARAAALAGDKEAVLARLGALKALPSKYARKLLERAATQAEFEGLAGDPAFKALLAPR